MLTLLSFELEIRVIYLQNSPGTHHFKGKLNSCECKVEVIIIIGILYHCTGLLVNDLKLNFVLLQLTSVVDDINIDYGLTSSTTLLPYTRFPVDTASCSSESLLP